ncbi:MAG: hypothetical protein AAFX50_19015, partial [Acidobacteriota bacterium]
PLASLRAAAETLDAFPHMAAERRAALMAVVLEEASRLGDALGALERSAESRAGGPGERRRLAIPALLDAVSGAAGGAGLDCAVESDPAPVPGTDPAVDVDPEGLERAIGGFAAALRRELAVGRLRISARPEPPHVLVDLAWRPEQAADAGPRECRGHPRGPTPHDPDGGLRPRERSLGGEAWFLLGREGRSAHVRLLFPGAPEAVDTGPPSALDG